MKNAEDAYEKAFELSKSSLAPTHPIRLGLALNYSVFFYEIKNDAEKACNMAKKVSHDLYASTVINFLYRHSMTPLQNWTN